MANHIVRVGDVEIMMLSDGMLEFDLCNFFPTIPEDDWQAHASHLTDEHKVRFNLGSYLIRADGRTILVDTGLGPRPADTPDVPWGRLLHDFQANGAPLELSQGSNAVVGLENLAGTMGYLYSWKQPVLRSGTAISFTPVP